MKKKIGTNGIDMRKCKLTFAALICIFALISVSAAVSEKGLWIASIEKNGDSVVFADHDDSQDEGGWIQLSGGQEIQLPEPLSFIYNGTNCVEKAGTVVKLNKDSNTEVNYTYPYSTHPFYTDGQKVTMTYNGPSAFKNQKVNVYLVNGSSVSSVKKAIVLAGNESINLGQIFGEGTDNSYIKLCATLDKKGDLLKPITFYSLKPGSYGIIVTLADDEDKESTSMEKKVLSATGFEVVNYELKTKADNNMKEGDNLDVTMSLKKAPADGKFTYGALLINEEAYKAEINVSSNGTIDGTNVSVNDIDLRDLGISSTNKSELTNAVQTLIGEGNGTISISDENQNTLSLTTFDLQPGNYLLFTGAYEPGKGLVGIDQDKLTISTKGTSPI
ncbi:TIGR04279 domain-containing protein [Methanosarcina barkeri]|nr:TIGR04279 domain-containing protein [Methanosarcina barkeri]